MARTIDELAEDFELFDSWEDKYAYVIDLGKKLPPMPDEEKTDDSKVKGCMSQVWITHRTEGGDPPKIRFHADSDAFIVKGLIAILMELYDGRTPEEIQRTDAVEALKRIGFENHLSPNRRNGFVAMVQRIRNTAQTHTA